MIKNEFLIDPRPIGEQVADRCKSAGISVSELCRRAKVQPYQVSTWKRHEPGGLISLRKIELALQDAEQQQVKE
jgi:transcriptional regulator with XRE-family HTH domain